MKKYLTIAILIIFPLFDSHAYAIDHSLGFLEKGRISQECKKDASLRNIKLYQKINGPALGYLSCYDYDTLNLKYVNLSGIEKIISHADDRVITGYEDFNFAYYEDRDGYINVLRGAFPGGFWIKKSEIGDKYIRSWMDLFIEDRPALAGFSGLKVYEDHNFRKEILLIPIKDGEENFEFSFTGNRYQGWAELIISEYNGNRFANNRVFIKKTRGWMKLINDDGSPKLDVTKGC